MKNPKEFKRSVQQVLKLLYLACFVFLLIIGFLVYLLIDPSMSFFKKDTEEATYVSVPHTDEAELDKIENGVHVRTGLVAGDGLMLVVNNCTSCHSAKLVTQNRMSKEQWSATIRWMQETQNLWDLGQNEEAIINYLATNYAPQKGGRRKNLENIEWYPLRE